MEVPWGWVEGYPNGFENPSQNGPSPCGGMVFAQHGLFVWVEALVQLCSSRTKQWEAATPDSHNRHSHALNSRARVKPTPGKGAKHDRINVNQRWLPPRWGHKGRKGEGVRTKRRVMISTMPQPHTAHTRTQCTSSNSKLIMH